MHFTMSKSRDEAPRFRQRGQLGVEWLAKSRRVCMSGDRRVMYKNSYVRLSTASQCILAISSTTLSTSALLTVNRSCSLPPSITFCASSALSSANRSTKLPSTKPAGGDVRRSDLKERKLWGERGQTSLEESSKASARECRLTLPA